MSIFNIQVHNFTSEKLSRQGSLVSVKDMARKKKKITLFVFFETPLKLSKIYFIVGKLLANDVHSLASLKDTHIVADERKTIKVHRSSLRLSSLYQTLKKRAGQQKLSSRIGIISYGNCLQSKKYVKNLIKSDFYNFDIQPHWSGFYCDRTRQLRKKKILISQELILDYEKRRRNYNTVLIKKKMLRERAFADSQMMLEKPQKPNKRKIVIGIRDSFCAMKELEFSQQMLVAFQQKMQKLASIFPLINFCSEEVDKVLECLRIFKALSNSKTIGKEAFIRSCTKLLELCSIQKERRSDVNLQECLSLGLKKLIDNMIACCDNILELQTKSFSDFHGFCNGFKFQGREGAVASLQGFRANNQDRHCEGLVKIKFAGRECYGTYLLLCDGHVSADAAQFCKKQFAHQFSKSYYEVISHKRNRDFQTVMWMALKKTFIKLDSEFLSQACDRSGTTAAACVLVNDMVFFASCGDSSAILVKPNEERLMLERAVSGDPRYDQSVEKRGGAVRRDGCNVPRINNWLQPARAIGDKGIPVSPAPKITCMSLDEIPKGSMIALVCDGITDVMTTKEIANTIRENQDNPKRTAETLVLDSIRERWSADNCTAIIYKIF